MIGPGVVSVAAVVAVAAPLLAAGLGVLAPIRIRHRRAAIVAVLGAAASLAAGIVCLLGADGPPVETRFLLADFGGITVGTGVLIDGVAAILAVAVGVVTLCVQVYSVAYLHDDARYSGYAAQVSLFAAAMLTVVVSGDLLVLLIGWEVMGACSYLLIGHYRDLPEAPGAAVKAFLVTRLGDVGFLLGVLLLGAGAGTFRISDVLAAVSSMSSATLTAAALLLLLGVAGKSAQFPLHTWLPDAMAGPTPISALIHAATMVAAGVFVILRLYDVFRSAPAAMVVLAVIASISMVLGALCALAQDDIKRVLAWSTISQLGYMTGALAAGGPAAGAFHLFAHAAFKALLFLAAGVVLHQLGTGLMSRLGGLRRSMPVTFVLTVLGLLALVGVLPLSGGFSKDAVLESAWAAARGEAGGLPGGVAVLLLAAMLVTVVLTAAYATRMLLRTFFGPHRIEGREARGALRWPLVVLAMPTVALGSAASWLSARLDPEWFAYGQPYAQPDVGYVSYEPLPPAPARPPDWLVGFTNSATNVDLSPQLDTALTSLTLAAVGALGIWLLWRRHPDRDPIEVLPESLRRLMLQGFGLDQLQHSLIVAPYRALARSVARFDDGVVDGIAIGVGEATSASGSALSQAHPKLPNLAVTALVVSTLALAVVLAVTA